ncbi:MAG: hypothetical protein JWP10_1456, partial [Nocardioidaceae bacterium]|nr:hypothetical protein [Nocardioidaceae bacterium]
MYAFAEDWKLLDARQRHLVHAYAVADALGPAVALSHSSAAAVWAIDTYGLDPTLVHVTRLDGGAGRCEYGVVHHVGRIVTPEDVVEAGGRFVMRPLRCVIESAMASSIESGVVLASSAMHNDHFQQAELIEHAGMFRRWQGARHANIAYHLADGRVESPGEARSLHMFWKHAIPRPTLQFEVRRSSGLLVGRSDFAWEDFRHLGEFDGAIKYGRLNPDPSNPGAVITSEKTREDGMRDEVFGMSRWTWPDLDAERASATSRRISM